MTNRRPTRRRHTGRRQAGPAVTLLAVALALGPVAASTSTPAADLGTPIPIKTTPAPVNETSPAADGRWFLWARGHANLGPDSLYLAQRGDSPRIRISASGTTVGEGGGISGRTVVYDQISEDARRAGLYLVDLRTGRRVRLPAAVNSRHVENGPSVSGRFLVFQRSKGSGSERVRRVVLYNRVTGGARGLATLRKSQDDVVMPQFDVGQVNGGHVVWARWRVRRNPATGATVSHSSVFRHDISTGTLLKVPRPAGAEDSHPAVSADGTMYFRRTTQGPDGSVVQVLRLPLGGTPEVVLEPEFSHDATDLFVDDRVGHRHHLYYVHAEYFPEDTSEYDVYKVVLSAPAS